MPTWLIAPNAFKHALKARTAAEAVARGIRRADPSAVCGIFPIGDGGDGTGGLLIEHLDGISVEARAEDPIGRIRIASYGLLEGGRVAVVELASASGLHLVQDAERDPLNATTHGTGTLIRHALDSGVENVLVCVGGSATVDGGMGILRALGFRFEDASGHELFLPSELGLLERVDATYTHKRIREVGFTVLCDVRNPLIGPSGAAAVFGPQKGADTLQVELLEKGLVRLSEVAGLEVGFDVSDISYGGAAGGAAAGMHAFLGAGLVSGIECFLDLTDFDAALKDADIVVTGEGSLDLQTLEGKAPMGVADRAKRYGRKVVCLAGSIDDRLRESVTPFDLLIDINGRRGTLERMLRDTEANLERAGEAMASIRT